MTLGMSGAGQVAWWTKAVRWRGPFMWPHSLRRSWEGIMYGDGCDKQFTQAQVLGATGTSSWAL